MCCMEWEMLITKPRDPFEDHNERRLGTIGRKVMLESTWVFNVLALSLSLARRQNPTRFREERWSSLGPIFKAQPNFYS